MSGYAGIFGSALIALACLLYARGYSSYIRRRAAEYASFSGFLELVRRETACSLSTAAELAERSSDSILEELGFLEAIRNGVTLGAAFDGISSRSLLAEEDRELLSRYFCDFGKGNLATELRAVDGCISAFLPRAEAEVEGASARIKLAKMLLALLAAAITILLI